MHAEAARGHLHDGIRPVLIEVLVKPALPGVAEDAELLSRSREGGVGVVADRAVAHGGEHHGHRQRDLRREARVEGAVRPASDLVRLLPEEDTRLHRFSERIDGRIGHLRGVHEHLVPVNRERIRVPHRREEHAARGRLLVDLVDRRALPVGVLAEGVRVLHDLQGSRRAEGHAPLAVHALRLVREQDPTLGIEAVHLVRALPLAHPAGDAAGLIPNDFKFRLDIRDCHQTVPPFTVTITGSPPAG